MISCSVLIREEDIVRRVVLALLLTVGIFIA